MIAILMFAAAAAAPTNCAKPDNQFDMSQCAQRDAQRADAAMNAQWTRTMHYMRENDTTTPPRAGEQTYASALLDAQRAWLKYRDTECALEGYSMRGGTGEGMVRQLCIAAATNARTKELRGLIQER